MTSSESHNADDVIQAWFCMTCYDDFRIVIAGMEGTSAPPLPCVVCHTRNHSWAELLKDGDLRGMGLSIKPWNNEDLINAGIAPPRGSEDEHEFVVKIGGSWDCDNLAGSDPNGICYRCTSNAWDFATEDQEDEP